MLVNILLVLMQSVALPVNQADLVVLVARASLVQKEQTKAPLDNLFVFLALLEHIKMKLVEPNATLVQI